KDLTELSLELGSHMVVLAERAKDFQEAKALLTKNMYNGKAIQSFKTFINAQGGDERIVDAPALLPNAKHTFSISAEKTGYISKVVADQIGKGAMLLGAGRQTKDSIINLAVGVKLHKKLGDYVQAGETLC